MNTKIKAAIKRSGKTAKSVAKAVGVTPQFLGMLASGARMPSPDLLIRLAVELDETPEGLGYELNRVSAVTVGPLAVEG